MKEIRDDFWWWLDEDPNIFGSLDATDRLPKGSISKDEIQFSHWSVHREIPWLQHLASESMRRENELIPGYWPEDALNSEVAHEKYFGELVDRFRL